MRIREVTPPPDFAKNQYPKYLKVYKYMYFVFRMEEDLKVTLAIEKEDALWTRIKQNAEKKNL
jgi:hypothetical protein